MTGDGVRRRMAPACSRVWDRGVVADVLCECRDENPRPEHLPDCPLWRRPYCSICGCNAGGHAFGCPRVNEDYDRRYP